jgi:photosystem II stability/assembly factor-like uncharacterized protein
MRASRCLPWSLAILIASTLTVATEQAPAGAHSSGDRIASGALKWRHIGPSSFGGRIDDIDAVADNPAIMFVAAASGGIFKTVNAGVTWAPVFDSDGGALSIGDIAIAPSDHNIVWAGTGEPNNRQSSSWGDGVYKSVDGGIRWRHMGLEDSHHIGRIVIHPTNPEIVYVAALGHLWGPNKERGLYKTVDGGRTWRNVLSVNADTGVVDVALDTDGRTLFAAAYERRRRGWGFVGGGPNGGLFRSLDSGETWERLAAGLPAGTVGRIGVEIAKSDPNIVFAIYEHKDGGVFRSQDRGATWVRMNPLNPRPSYYSQIRIDPQNPHKVWVLGGTLAVSIDAGKTFSTEGTGERIHVDHHALWIHPKNPDHLALGNDGGLYLSHDGSRNWNFIDNLPIGQYYDIGIDKRDPYWIYGGTQDNGTWGIPSRTSNLVGIMNSDVVNIAYGDGFYTQPDPTDPRYVYANSQSGRTYLIDLDTREERGIRPVPEDAKETYRFNWSTPMLVSPHDSKVVYYGGNKLFRTDDRGHTWREVSPDLTLNQEWKKLPVLGPERSTDTLSRDDGVSDFGTITAIDESPRQAGVIYVGTDDGQVQMTRDGGKTWTNVTSRFVLPGPRWVSRVLASRSSAGTAYAVFDGHQDDDFKPYIFKTTDFGAKWSSVAGDIPDGMVVNALAEHPRNPQLLFAGTEFGLFYTIDGGGHWTHARGNLPRVPVDDIVIEERSNDVILGTHGRSIIILDDISALEHLDEARGRDAHLFPIRPATAYYEARMLPVPGAGKFAAPNPDYGALITYYLRSDPPAPKPDGKAPLVTIKVEDSAGRIVRELEGPDRAGVNRVAWDLRHALGIPFTGEGREGWFGVLKGPFVAPGEYTVKLTARGRELTQKVIVNADPRARTSVESLRLRNSAGLEVNELLRAYDDAAKAVRLVDQEFETLKELFESQPKLAPELRATFDEMLKKFQVVKDKFRGGGFGGPRFQITDLGGSLQASSFAPTEAQARLLARLTADITTHITQLNELITTELPGLQARVRASGVAPGKLEAVRPPRR